MLCYTYIFHFCTYGQRNCIFLPFLISFDCNLFCLVSYEMSAIKYVWKNDESTLKKSPSLKTLNAYLDRNHTTECPSTGSWRGKIIYFKFTGYPIIDI